ncbi:MAG: hypothetical protein WA771_09535, partial [Chthoniobacterales bacterium]
GLLDRDVRLVRLGYPRVLLRPEAFGKGGSGNGNGAGAGGEASEEIDEVPEWSIGRIKSDYGEVRLTGMGGKIPEISAKVAFDLTDVGDRGDLGKKLHEVVVWDAWARGKGAGNPFLALDLGKVTFSVDGLMDKVIDEVAVTGGDLTIGQQLKDLLAEEPRTEGGGASEANEASEANDGGDEKSRAWVIGDLSVEGVRTRLEDDRVDVSDANFTINSTFKNVAIGAARDGLAEEVQTVEFADLVIRSPRDPTAKIVTLRSVFVRFTLSGLLNDRIREIVILRPTVFLSQDLFVYMEAATGGNGAEAIVAEEVEDATRASVVDGSPADVAILTEQLDEESEAGEAAGLPGWEVDRLEVKFGSLVIGSGGDADVGLPLEFETLAENVEFGNLAALRLQAALRIPRQSYAFESYQLELRAVEGDLQFAYPPELGVNNVVQKLDIAKIRWRQYQADEAWLAVTFDAQGINGEFGGVAYDGYVNGGFSFFFQTDSPWIGWVTGTAVNMESLTDIVSPDNFALTGPADFEVQVDAFAKSIDRLRGNFALTKPGTLRIGKLDDVIERISPDWWTVKRDLTRIGLETLRDFEYTDAGGNFWFVQSRGILKLDLVGPHGSREFEVALHQGPDSGGRWQMALPRGRAGRDGEGADVAVDAD